MNKGTKEGIVGFVSARPTQKDHVTNEEVKSCNNRKIQEIRGVALAAMSHAQCHQ